MSMMSSAFQLPTKPMYGRARSGCDGSVDENLNQPSIQWASPLFGVTVQDTLAVPWAGTVTVLVSAEAFSPVEHEVSGLSPLWSSLMTQVWLVVKVCGLSPRLVSAMLTLRAELTSLRAALGLPSTVASTWVLVARSTWASPAPI